MGNKIETPLDQEDRDVMELDCKDLQALSNGQNINISFKQKQKRNKMNDSGHSDTDLSVQLRRGIFKKHLKDESQSGSFIDDGDNSNSNSRFTNTFKSQGKKDSLISKSMDNDSLFVISKLFNLQK